LDVDLVVSGAVVGAEDEGLGEGVDELGIPGSGDGYAVEGAEGDEDIVEGAAAAFLEEVGSIAGFGSDYLADGGEGGPGFVGAG
jgi:hypothetical protein